jgi:hypothetical protein
MNLDAYLKSESILASEEVEIYHWTNNYILDGFLVDLAIQKGLIKNYAEFNEFILYLSPEDLESLVETIQDYIARRFPFKGKSDYEVAKLKWQKALHIFENCLTAIDFKKNTLYYYCTLTNS